MAAIGFYPELVHFCNARNESHNLREDESKCLNSYPFNFLQL